MPSGAAYRGWNHLEFALAGRRRTPRSPRLDSTVSRDKWRKATCRAGASKAARSGCQRSPKSRAYRASEGIRARSPLARAHLPAASSKASQSGSGSSAAPRRTPARPRDHRTKGNGRAGECHPRARSVARRILGLLYRHPGRREFRRILRCARPVSGSTSRKRYRSPSPRSRQRRLAVRQNLRRDRKHRPNHGAAPLPRGSNRSR